MTVSGNITRSVNGLGSIYSFSENYQILEYSVQGWEITTSWKKLHWHWELIPGHALHLQFLESTGFWNIIIQAWENHYQLGNGPLALGSRTMPCIAFGVD